MGRVDWELLALLERVRGAGLTRWDFSPFSRGGVVEGPRPMAVAGGREVVAVSIVMAMPAWFCSSAIAGGGAMGKVAVRGVWVGEKPPVATLEREERMLGEKW